MGLKIKKILSKPVEAVKKTVSSLAQGDLVGAAKGALQVGALINPITGLPYATALAAKEQFSSLSAEEQAAQATLNPVDPNAEMARQMEEERKRRLRTPGRAQYMLTSANNLPSLIGDNSALGKNGLY